MRKKLQLLLAFLCVCIGMATAQTSKVVGVVYSAGDNEPVVGASVLVKGTTLGTITDIDGRFELSNLPGSAKTLLISFVGLKTQEVAIKSNLKVILESDAEELEEVMVVAYGTAKKSSFTGAASTVGAKTLDKRVVTNVTSALEGNAPGIQVTSATGQPGESASIRIRGFGSANADNAPLYVVDGSVYDGYLGDINPADIESMTILKDAASTALYGSSAGNGVILITTKAGKGTSGKTNVGLTINQGWSNRAYKDYAKMDTYQHFPVAWQMMKNARISAGSNEADAAAYATKNLIKEMQYNPFLGAADDAMVTTDGVLNPSITGLKWGEDLDWEDLAFNTGHRQEYILSYDTKTDKSDTYASIGYLKDNGYLLKTDFERYTGRLNYNIYPVKWLKSGINLGFTRTLSNYSTSTSSSSSSYNNLQFFTRKIAPYYPIHAHDLVSGEYLNERGEKTTDPSEYIYDYANRLKGSFVGRDGIAETELNDRNLQRMNESGKVYMTLMPIEGLSMTVNYSLNNTDYRRKVYENPYVGDGTSGPGRLNILSTRTLTQTFNQVIQYTHKFGKHNTDITLGHENYEYKYEYMYGMKVGENVSGIYDFENFLNINTLTSYTDTYRKEGYFGRLNYDYDNKYYVSLSYRHDGSSRFAKDNRWGDFYSVGLSWRASQEEFLKDVSWIDNLKIRASYGQTGNDHILDSDGYQSYYPYRTLYVLGKNNGTEGGVYFQTIANSALTWETQISTDLGVEFALFGKLNGSVEYFRKDSKDLLFNVAQPYSTGVNSITQNIGKLSNSGVEINLDYNILQNDDWNLSFGANVTFLKNKIKNLPESMKENGYISGSKKWMEGKSIYEFWLRQWAGVDPATGDGVWLPDYETYNEKAVADGSITQSSLDTFKKHLRTVDGKEVTDSYTYAKYDWSGASIPKVYGGFNFNVGYKSLSLSATFSYQLGGKVLDNAYRNMMSVTTSSYATGLSPDLMNAWTKPGDVTDVPRLDASSTHSTNIDTQYSTRWLVSSNYLNLRSINVGYQLPKSLISKAMLKSARLNLTVENVFMLKARQGLNPMANYSGFTYNEYMPSRNITLGLNVSF